MYLSIRPIGTGNVLTRALVAVVTALLCWQCCCVADAAEDDFRYLAVDGSYGNKLYDATIVMKRASYVGKVLERDQPWEDAFRLGYPGSVVVDPESGKLRMYYELMNSEEGKWEDRAMGMAESEDGLTWTKPALNITGDRYTTDPRNNCIDCEGTTWMQGPMVFVDPNAPRDQRYKMSHRVRNVMYTGTSADGLHFVGTGVAERSGHLDTLNVTFWDPMREQWAAFMRQWYFQYGDLPKRRGVAVKWSDSWAGTWSTDRKAIVDPKDAFGRGTYEPDIYTPGVMPYHGQYIGLPSLFFHPAPDRRGPIYPTFMHSRDGVSWRFEDYRHSILDLAVHGHTEEDPNLAAYATTSIIERDGKLWIYYVFSHRHHGEIATGGPSAFHLATLREDGFAAIESNPGKTGFWETKPIRVPKDAKRLLLNAEVSGGLRIAVLDAETRQPIPGFSTKDSTPLDAGDYLAVPARWEGASLGELAARLVILQFNFDDTSIYSFRFSASR